MKEIYAIYGAITKDTDMFGAFSYYLPETKKVTMNFKKLDFSSPSISMSGNILENLEIEFNNGKSLPIEGVYFHKFFNSPPFALESSESNHYISNNPYLENYSPSEMMDLIRKGFLNILEKIDLKTEFEQLKKIEIQYKKNKFTISKTLFPELKKEHIKELENQSKNFLNSIDSSLTNKLIEFIEESLLKPRIERTMIREGDNLRNSFNEIEWTNLSLLKYKDFIHELDSQKDKDVPFYSPLKERLKDETKDTAFSALKYSIADLTKTNIQLIADLTYYYKENNNKIPDDLISLVEYLFNAEDLPFTSLLLDYWWEKFSNVSVTELLKLKSI